QLKIMVRLTGPFPLPVVPLGVAPARSVNRIDSLRELVVHPEPAPADKVLTAGIVGREDPLVVLVTFLVFDLPKAVVVADHASGIFKLAALWVRITGDLRIRISR